MCVPKMRERICSKLSSSAATGASAAAAAAGVGAAAAAYCRQPPAAAAGLLRAAWDTAGARQRRELRVEAVPSCCAAQGASSRASRCNPLSTLLMLQNERRSAMAGAVCSERVRRAGSRAGCAQAWVFLNNLLTTEITAFSTRGPIVCPSARMKRHGRAGLSGEVKARLGDST